MSRQLFRAGDRVRLTVPTLGGWIGTGVVIVDQEADVFSVAFRKDGSDPDDTDATVCANWTEVELIDRD